MQLTRHSMYRMINKAMPAKLSGKVLGISGISKIGSFLDTGSAEITTADYPEVDMQSLPYGDANYDAVIADQVIEHLESPMRAVLECHRVLKPGGIAIITTCFLNPLHPSPRDLWRISPEGLKELFPDETWEVVELGGWGNRGALILILLWDRIRFLEVGKRGPLRWLGEYNETKYPIVTWIVARKR